MENIEQKRQVLKGCLIFATLIILAMLISNFLDFLAIRHRLYMRSLQRRKEMEERLNSNRNPNKELRRWKFIIEQLPSQPKRDN